MGVMLYRPGNTHIIRDVTCEMGVFPVEMLEDQLKSGWKTDLNSLYNAAETEDTLTVESLSDADLDGMSNKEIREAARIMGLKDWDTARITTLKMELTNGDS